MAGPVTLCLPMSAHDEDEERTRHNAGEPGFMRPGVPLVRRADLVEASTLCGSQFTLLAPDLPSEGAALRGHFEMARLRSGVVLHATDTYDMHDLTTRLVHSEGLTISLFLEGMADVSLGGRRFLLGPGANGGEPEGIVIARAEPHLFQRQGRRGTHVRKVNVSIPVDWLEGEALGGLGDHRTVRAFSRDHLASAHWRPSPRLVALAEQILRPRLHGPLLHALQMESRALEIAAEALGMLGDEPAIGIEPAQHFNPRDRRRMWEVHDFIESRLNTDLTLAEVARAAGMSINSLQRLFRATFGMTVFEYVRQRKLELARDALEGQGLSVSQAAYMAGYNSSANFSTAFRRAFGVPPKSVRRRQ